MLSLAVDGTWTGSKTVLFVYSSGIGGLPLDVESFIQALAYHLLSFELTAIRRATHGLFSSGVQTSVRMAGPDTGIAGGIDTDFVNPIPVHRCCCCHFPSRSSTQTSDNFEMDPSTTSDRIVRTQGL